MRAVDLIQKKRDGQELTSSEIEWLIEGYVSGTVPDYQMSQMSLSGNSFRIRLTSGKRIPVLRKGSPPSKVNP